MALNKKVLAIGIGAVAVAGAVVGVVIAKAQPKGMTIAVSELPDSLNPVLEQNTSGLNANELIFDGLVNFEVDPSTGKRYTEFALAEDIVQDEKTRKNYTVTLRDVAWNDGEDGNPGTPVTSADVVYSFKAYTFEGNRSPKRDYILSFIKDVTAVDDKTVNIEFNDPIPSYKAIPVLDFKIVPSKYNGIDMNVDMRSGENERKFSQNPVGTGPFKLTSWDIGKWLTFQSNGLYFKKTPQADSLVIKRTIDPVVRKNELSKGRINVILETNPMDRPTIEKIDNVDINSFLPYAFYQIEINTSLFKSADARKAMAQALDKKNLIPSITDQESGVVINNGLYPTNIFQEAMPEYVNEPLPNLLPYDLEKAKSLASSSGLAGQNVNLIYPDSMGDFGKALAEGVANQLKEIGLNVEAKRIGNQVFNRMVYKEKSYELALVYHDGFDNFYSSIDTLYRTGSEANVTGIADRELDSLFDELATQNKTEDVAKQILKINEKVSDLCPALYLCTLQKDVYSRGLSNVLIASDNPFLSVEDWEFKN